MEKTLELALEMTIENLSEQVKDVSKEDIRTALGIMGVEFLTCIMQKDINKMTNQIKKNYLANEIYNKMAVAQKENYDKGVELVEQMKKADLKKNGNKVIPIDRKDIN